MDTHIKARRRKSSCGELGAGNTKYLLHFFRFSGPTRDFLSPFLLRRIGTYSIIITVRDRETRAEPSNRDRHGEMRSCMRCQGGVERGREMFAQVSNCCDGMMCFDDETACRMVTFEKTRASFVTVCKLQAFFLSFFDEV